jgi:hypothetical protein
MPRHGWICLLAFAAGPGCTPRRDPGALPGRPAIAADLACGSDDDCGGLSCCAALCVDTTLDPANCGACGVACPDGTSCVASACACPGTQTLCDAGCVDTRGDPKNCGGCGVVCPFGQSCSASACVPSLGYPTRTAYRIKGLQPDGWDPVEVAGNNTGGVAMNLVWASFEPTVTLSPCAANQMEYDGHCFAVSAGTDAAIADWTARGVVVTGILYGTPAWAHAGRACAWPGREIFCAPDDGADFGRFVGMIARRYDGLHGHGRVADFVIQNEVNANDWFDIGCGNGTPCDVAAWIDAYADDYSAAYDRASAEQPSAKVLVSLEHHFGPGFDLPAATHPLLSGQTLLIGLAARLGARAWRVAYHPYPPSLLAPQFSPDDWPKVTYGNLGTLAGWLRKTFPKTPSSWEIQLTESGINSLAPSSPAAQADGVCRSFRNVLGTPGIESYIYHRMKDHPDETVAGLGLGLRAVDGTAKPAWAVWALANRNDLAPAQLSCGFEELPYTRLTRSFSAPRGHWASSRLPPPGFVSEKSWRLLRDPQPGTTLLYECRVGDHSLLTPLSGCENLLPLGPVGYIYDAPAPGRQALYRCRVGAGSDHFITADPGCEQQTFERLLGYALP